MSTETHDWYWDLRRQQAVRADERGPGDDTLGPYASKHEAEHWKERVDARNDAWDDADEKWEHGESTDEH